MPGLIENRITFELAEDVDPTLFYGISKADANIEVHSKYNKKKKYMLLSESLLKL